MAGGWRAAVLAGLVAALVACSPAPPSPTASAPASAPATTPAVASSSVDAIASASASPAATGLAGQPVLTVEQALARHTAHPASAGSLVVTGWFGSVISTGGPFPGTIDPLEYFYPMEWLMSQPEILTTTVANGSASHGPTVTALTLKDLGGTGFPGQSLSTDPARPPTLTLVGHFDDPESVLCEPDARAACRDAFVVDGFFGADGALVPPLSTTISASGRLTPDEARAAAAAAHPGLAPLATIFIGDGRRSDQAGAGDVRLLVAPWPGSGDHGWLVRLLALGGDAPPVTVFVDDADAAVHELPKWPMWTEPPTAGRDGADAVAAAPASRTCESNSIGGGFFMREQAGGDLYLVNPMYGTRQRVLADHSRPLFVRGTGFDTVVLDADGTPVGQGTLRYLEGCQGNTPDAPFVFLRIQHF
jgi:hypothetical protein